MRAPRAVNAPTTGVEPPSSRPIPSLEGADADELRAGIATFYDESSKLWEDVWYEKRKRRRRWRGKRKERGD
jgi:hypothetical protein